MGEKAKILALAIGDRWPLIFRCLLYVVIGALPVFVEEMAKFGRHEAETSVWLVGAMVLRGIYGGCVALKAYFDGSAQVIASAIAAKQRAKGSYDTDHFFKEAAPTDGGAK